MLKLSSFCSQITGNVNIMHWTKGVGDCMTYYFWSYLTLNEPRTVTVFVYFNKKMPLKVSSGYKYRILWESRVEPIQSITEGH